MRFPIALSLLLGACATAPDGGGGRGGPPAAGLSLGAGCAGSDIPADALVGHPAAGIPFDDFPFPVRVVAPGMAVTMDYSADRLTVETDRRGIITRFGCG